MLGRLSPFPFGMANNFQCLCSTSRECFFLFFSPCQIYFFGGMFEDLNHCVLRLVSFSFVSVFFLFGGGTLDVFNSESTRMIMFIKENHVLSGQNGEGYFEKPPISGQNIGPHDDGDDDDDDDDDAGDDDDDDDDDEDDDDDDDDDDGGGGQIVIEMKFTVLHICIFRK